MKPGCVYNAWHRGERAADDGHPKLVGRARYDIESSRFTHFELVALGTRWGGTQYNGRADDLDPAPMGVAFTISKSKLRVAPASIWKY